MNEQGLFALLFLAIFLLLVLGTYWMHDQFGVPSEQSRKFLHVSGGLLSLCAPLFFTDHWWMLGLCLAAFLLLLITYIKKLLPAVHRVRRRSVGSVIFPIPVYTCFLAAKLLHNDLLFYLPVSLLTISDVVAEWSGTRWGRPSLSWSGKGKTFAGSSGFFLSALVLSLAWCLVFGLPFTQLLLITFTAALISTAAEWCSPGGWDNLSVPLATLLVLIVLG